MATGTLPLSQSAGCAPATPVISPQDSELLSYYHRWICVTRGRYSGFYQIKRNKQKNAPLEGIPASWTAPSALSLPCLYCCPYYVSEEISVSFLFGHVIPSHEEALLLFKSLLLLPHYAVWVSPSASSYVSPDSGTSCLRC